MNKRLINKLEMLKKFKKKKPLKVDLDISHPTNDDVLAFLRKAKNKNAPPIAHPDSVFDPYLQQGSHPDIVAKVWDKIGASLPVDCRYLIHGTPALVHPKSGIIFVFCLGTRYCVRVPPRYLDDALATGARTYTKWSTGDEIDTQRDIGSDWVFGGWDDMEVWCYLIYEELGTDI